jgi:hypothetical protein
MNIPGSLRLDTQHVVDLLPWKMHTGCTGGCRSSSIRTDVTPTVSCIGKGVQCRTVAEKATSAVQQSKQILSQQGGSVDIQKPVQVLLE